MNYFKKTFLFFPFLLGLLIFIQSCGSASLQKKEETTEIQTKTATSIPTNTISSFIEWQGNYEYFEALEGQEGAPFWGYSLSLEPISENKYKGKLVIDGTQTMQRFKVEATANQNQLSVILKEYGEDNIFQNPALGSELFILEETTDNSTQKIITTWKALEPNLEATPRSGHVAFEKKSN